MIIAAALLQLLAITTLDGREVHVNPMHIVSISEARSEDDPHKQFTGKAHCVLTLINGKLITVAEPCRSLRQRLQSEVQP
jgi:uncharacterized protein YlzI (FlbEa/FlbD family)